MNAAVRQVVVLGGGSAGWLTAALLAAEHGRQQGGRLDITLVESPDTPPIGVGEGTWPSMRDTLRRIGLDETDLLRECDAAFKQGSRFDGWQHGGTAADGDRYHHPFSMPLGWDEADLVAAWLPHAHEVPFAHAFSPQPRVCEAGRAPKQPATPAYAAVTNYAYHFDAGRFGQLLQRHAVQRLGVRHVLAHVQHVVSADNGDIAALHTAQQGAIAGDLFVDCSGLPSLLLGAHYGVPLQSHRDRLFNDRALALQVPYASDDAPLATQTIATAQAAGWTWDIGLPTRRGVGLVYSSAHCSDDEAEATLRRHVAASGGPADAPPARRLRYDPGHRRQLWVRNCVAIGLSSGFVEPLEASALAMVELSAAMLADLMPADREQVDWVARRFNDAFDYRWQRIVDFLKLHYVLSRRDEPYWRDHRQPHTLGDTLRENLALWAQRSPSRHDLPRMQEVFPAASYQYVLYGMGFRPQARAPRAADNAPRAEAAFREADAQARRMLAALPDHRALLRHIQAHGQPST